ncbi:MAG: AsmA-like C-terminal domain-containing protein [Phycisphaerales bacterium]|nr:AsmA-like C-terminal domain-containing protein [Phycisphaerales bacterium]
MTLRRILDRLRLEGTVECDAEIGPRSNNQLGYDVEALITGGTARPMPMPELYPSSTDLTIDPIAMDEILGTIYLTEELIIVDLEGQLYAPDQPLAPTQIHVLTQLTLPAKTGGLGGVRRQGGLLPMDYGPPAPGPRMYVNARADGLDLAMPLEHAVAVVSPTIAREMSAWRSRTNPDGVLAVQSTIEGHVGGYASTTLVLDHIEHLALDLGGQRYRAGASYGRATLNLGVLPRIALDGFRVPLEVDGVDAGVLTLNGELSLARGQRYYEPRSDDVLDVHYAQGRLGSGLVRAIVARGAGEERVDVIRDYQIDGVFDLSVQVTPRSVGLIDRGVDGAIVMPPFALNGRFEPRSLLFTMNERAVEFPEMTGVVRFEGTEGTIDEIHGVGDGYSMRVDGDWAINDSGLGVDLTVDAMGGVLDSPLRAVMPAVLDRVVESLELGSTGAVDITGLKLVADGIGSGQIDFNVTGEAEIVGGYATIGMPITEFDGTMEFVAAGKDGNVGYEIGLRADRLRAGSLRMLDGRVQIIGDASRPGVVLIPEINASMHGGRVAGSAQIHPTDDGRSRFWADLHSSGVRATPMFNDLLLPAGGLEGPPMPGEESVLSAWDVDDDFSRGVILADLSMSGIVGEPENRAGRGFAQVSGGSVVALPGIINVIEASNLRLPVGSKLQEAEGEFYIDGNTLAFERISASSKSIEILGYGTMDWVDKTMDLRFRSRSLSRIPVLSTIFEGLRDELITTKVTGTPGNPTYSVDQFGSTKRVFSALLGRSETDHQRRLREVEQSVDASRSKAKNPTAGVVHESTPLDEPWGQWVNEDSSDN